MVSLPGTGPAYLRLADDIRARILDGRLVVGDRVPAERVAAGRMGASRTTVAAAYDLLRGEGFLVSRQGSGTVAALPVVTVDRPDETTSRSPVEIDLTTAALPAPPRLGALAADAMAELGPLLCGAGLHPMGLRALRAQIADRYTARGQRTSADQILVTQGALHAWALILRACARPGDRVLVEQPTYAGAVDAARAHGVRVRPLPVDARGWTVPRRPVDARLAHLTADHHNPTGHHATRSERRELLRALSGVTVVVDETFAELGFPGSRTEAPAGILDARIITVGSLSKAVWAGLRVGWIRSDPATVRRLADLRTAQDLATPVLDQLLARHCLRELDAILAERRELLARRCDHALRVLAGAAPNWTVHPPSGGMLLWVDLGATSSTQLAGAVRSLGVRVAPGPRYSVTGTHDRFLRLPLVHPEAVFADAVTRLTRAAGMPARRRADTGPAWTT